MRYRPFAFTIIILFGIASLFCFRLPFFGDHVTLGSHPAGLFYTSHFSSLILPADADTGHPPLYPVLLAGWWEIAGRSLIASHVFAMLFFLLMIYFIIKTAGYFLETDQKFIAIALILLYPVVFAQLAAMSVDIPLTTCFFAGLYAILTRKRILLFIALLIAPLLSLRGIMTDGSLFIFHLFTERKKILPVFSIYLAAALPFCAWLFYHHAQTGWWISSDTSPWQGGKEILSGIGFLYKAGEYILRFFEYGMILPWLILCSAVFRRKKESGAQNLYLLLVISIILFACVILPFRNPVLIRYLLPVQIMAILLFVKIISGYQSAKRKNILLFLASILFVAWNFIAYPEADAKKIFYTNWGDGSMSHVSYFAFRERTKNYITQHNINPHEVYTSFPEYKPFYDTDLSNEDCQYSNMNMDSIDSYPYIIWSNIMNDVPLSVRNDVLKNWIPVLSLHHYPVSYYLLKNPADTSVYLKKQ